MKKLYILSLIACSFAACKPNLDPETPSKGSANFERYLAVGNSLTAGYSDGSLYRSGQINSYPAILAGQFALVGGGEFKQPLLPGEYGYPGKKLVLRYPFDNEKGCVYPTELTPLPFAGATDSFGSSASIAPGGPYNNTGIPGIRAIDYVFPGYGAFNPYSRRFFSNLDSSPIDEIIKVNPTFFSVWVGSNDVLDFASKGGFESTAKVSNAEQFAAAYDTILSKLTKNGAKGIVMNIPDITSTPYFTTISPRGLMLTKRQADDLNVVYNGTGVRFTEGANRFVIESGGKFRHINDGEFILLSLPMDSVRCHGWGSVKPIPGQYILTENEVSLINQGVSAFNGIIASAASRYGLPLADMNQFLKTINSGFEYNGVSYSTKYVTGSAFSLDGLHLTPRGYALAANRIIERINSHYGSTIPNADPNKYPGIIYP